MDPVSSMHAVLKSASVKTLSKSGLFPPIEMIKDACVCVCLCLCTVQCLLPMKTHSGLVAHVITPPKLFVRPVALHAAQCVVGNLSALCRVGVVDIVVTCLCGLSLSRVCLLYTSPSPRDFG